MTLVFQDEHAPRATVADAGRVIVAVADPATRVMMSERLAEAFGLEIAGACSMSTLIGLLAGGEAADLVLLDLSLPGIGGLAGLLYFRSRFAGVPCVAMPATGDAGVVRRCLDAGAAAVLPATEATADTIADVIGAVLDGAEAPEAAQGAGAGDETLRRLKNLTPQQLRVLALLCPGLLNKQIAYELGVSEATVKAHVSAILQKLGVDGRAQAVEALVRLNGGEPSRGLQAA